MPASRSQARRLATAGAAGRRSLFQDEDEVVTFDLDGERRALSKAYFGAPRESLEFEAGMLEKIDATLRCDSTELPASKSLVGKKIERCVSGQAVRRYRIADVQADPINPETVCALTQL